MAVSTSKSRRSPRPIVSWARILWVAAALMTLLLCFRISSTVRQPRTAIRAANLKPRNLADSSSRCNLVNLAKDSCKWVQDNCPEEEPGLVSYLQLYYCGLGHVKPIAFIIITTWLCLLFSTIGIAASDFFSVNLSTIAAVLGLSEDLAGVTFLALGNGSPDVFSTFAAMSTHSGSLAIGELIGAAGFITAVVAGSMALIRPFQVAKAGFIRDVTFFICASVLTMILLADGKLLMWECILMVSFYVAYVIVVVTWHWFRGRRSARNAREARARAHFLVQEAEDLDNTSPTTRVSGDASFDTVQTGHLRESFHALESASRYAVDGDPDDDSQQQQAITEINQSMRVVRPTRHLRRPTANPIRPSLVGALEFRSVLSSLQKSRSQSAVPISLRRYSDGTTFARSRPQAYTNISAYERGPPARRDQLDPLSQWPPYRDEDESSQRGRNRAVSANDAAIFASRSTPEIRYGGRPSSNTNLSLDTQNVSSRRLGGQSTSSAMLDGNESSLHPTSFTSESSQPERIENPTIGPELGAIESRAVESSDDPVPGMNRRVSSGFLLTPGADGSSPSVPFPTYADDHRFTRSPSRANSFKLPPPGLGLGQEGHESGTALNGLRWWPYSVLPEPEVFFSTLFPTLYQWSYKSFWARMLGLVAAPSILLLTITLPVVAMDEDDEDDDVVDPAVPTVNITSAEDTNTTPLPPLISVDSPSEVTPLMLDTGSADDAPVAEDPARHSRGSETRSVSSALPTPATDGDSSDSNAGWNRWLVCIQVFMAPFFVILIIWANADETGSLRNLAIYEAYAMIAALVMLALLLITTDPIKPPKYRPLLCFVGFIVSVAWISTIANEVVGVLKALGVIFGISEAILGLTVFAVGNSLGDLVADITIARLGYPVMAFSACIGGPMLNILLGIGLGGLYMTIGHHADFSVPVSQRSFHIEVGSTLLVSSVALLVTLLGLLIAVPLNKWMMDRKIGLGLLALWVVATTINLVIEVTGVGRHKSQYSGSI